MKKKRLILTVLVCILAAVSWYYEEFLYQPEPMSGLDVYFIDVGQGDAALLVCDGYTMLIDGGDNPAENTVADFLTGHGITYLDYIVSTHPHRTGLRFRIFTNTPLPPRSWFRAKVMAAFTATFRSSLGMKDRLDWAANRPSSVRVMVTSSHRSTLCMTMHTS